MSDPKPPGARAPPIAETDPAALAQTQKLAEIGLMTSAVLHELKQPLAGIKGYAQILREKTEPPWREKAEQILAQVERLEGLVAAHRRFLHAGGGKAPVDLGELAAEAARVLEARARGEAVTLELRARPARVEADRAQLLQILANLLANAVDAAAAGGERRVQILVRAEAGGPEVLVADWGAGISPAVQGRLFSALVTTKGPERGTGLGLYVSRALAEANGATLEVVAPGQVGSDARTVFRLRFAPAAAAARHRVLVVDDEEVMRSLFKDLLEPEGYELHFAESGDEALRQLAQQGFDLVVSDKNLPGASGLEVARAARTRHPGCRVILMTGYSSLEAAQEGLSIGLVDYLEKPFDDIGTVRRRIRDVLRAPPASPAAPRPAPADGDGRAVLVIEDRPADATRIGDAVAAAGWGPILVASVPSALARLATGKVAGVILSLDLKGASLSPESFRALRKGTIGPLITLADRPSLEQTIFAIRMGAKACLPRALASAQALARELGRVLGAPPGEG